MGFYSTLTEAIEAYTGLSPMAFFTILALMVGVYKLVCSMFVVPEDFKALREAYLHQAQAMGSSSSFPVAAEPVQLGDVTEVQLRAYDGSDPQKPLLMAIKGQIYDVSRSRMFYGPGGPYALFAGRDASRALALMSFEPKELTGNIEGLSSSELETLQDWEYKFMEKYVKVGQLVTEKTSAEETGIQKETGESQETKREGEDDSSDLNSKAAEAKAVAI